MNKEAIAIELTKIFVEHASNRLCLTSEEIFDLYIEYLNMLNGEEDE